MKAKLVKTKNGFGLSDCELIAFVSSKRPEHKHHKLSLKNCEAIANGCNLDEYQEGIFYASKFGHPSPEGFSEEQIGRLHGFIDGFQEALELKGDKKFSENDVLQVVTHVLKELVLFDGFDKKYLFPESIYQETTSKCKSLQQNEWDVEIEMEDVFVKNDDQYIDEVGVGNYSTHSKKPKLDADGCLILKRL